MLVAGKIYHCTQCAEKIRVEYEGGAAMTQVGEEVFYQQSEMVEGYIAMPCPESGAVN